MDPSPLLPQPAAWGCSLPAVWGRGMPAQRVSLPCPRLLSETLPVGCLGEDGPSSHAGPPGGAGSAGPGLWASGSSSFAHTQNQLEERVPGALSVWHTRVHLLWGRIKEGGGLGGTNSPPFSTPLVISFPSDLGCKVVHSCFGGLEACPAPPHPGIGLRGDSVSWPKHGHPTPKIQPEAAGCREGAAARKASNKVLVPGLVVLVSG